MRPEDVVAGLLGQFARRERKDYTGGFRGSRGGGLSGVSGGWGKAGLLGLWSRAW